MRPPLSKERLKYLGGGEYDLRLNTPWSDGTVRFLYTNAHFQNYPLDELLMPPPFSGANNFDHSNISTNARDEIREWCSSLNLRQQESVGE